MQAVGIIGLGSYLPPTVRTNDHWSADIVAGWHDRMAARATSGDAPRPEQLSDGVRLTLEAMTELAGDPFRGAVERRVMGPDMTVSKMEASAAREAMARAGIDASQVDVILSQTPVPEHLFVNGACVTHKLLELPRRCLSIGTEAACNAFAQHFSLAQALIASGKARYVLSVHSSAMARVLRASEPDSAWWGDGAAAVVFGPVAEGKGLLGAVHNTDGASSEALVLGIPDGRRWWEDGAITTCSVDRAHTRAMLLSLVDRARDTIGDSMSEAHIAPADVDFYASHQGTVWLPRVTAKHAGLGHVPTITTFPQFGNLNSANIPLILAIAEREGMLRDGSTLVTFSGGLGETWSSLCVRWGR